MNFSINGVVQPSDEFEGRSFDELLKIVGSKLGDVDGQLISSIKVNGVEISETEEMALSTEPCAKLESVEITLAHPREIAEDTLQTLKIFAGKLADLSLRAADEFEDATPRSESYLRLIDGIQTFVESILSVRQVLRIGLLQPVRLLEADLLSIAQDLLAAHMSGDRAYRGMLLRNQLPACMDDWAQQGIPAMISCRDS